MSLLRIAICPTCGSTKIKKVCRNWSGEFEGRSYRVPSLEFYECPACSEKVYGREAMRKIQGHFPAFAKERAAT